MRVEILWILMILPFQNLASLKAIDLGKHKQKVTDNPNSNNKRNNFITMNNRNSHPIIRLEVLLTTETMTMISDFKN